ncbi:MAG TPA: hypothetical protein V6C97_13275 [Oculatellaceae cyanobacterium]
MTASQGKIVGEEETLKSSQMQSVPGGTSLSPENQDDHSMGSGVQTSSKNPAEFRLQQSLAEEKFDKVISWIKDQKTLFDAFLVALSFHVVMFPVLWFVGWALPWPKPPVVTTIVEFDLQEWMKSGKPKKIIEFRDPELNP